MATLRPGLADKSGHAEIITNQGLSDTQLSQGENISTQLVTSQAEQLRSEISEISLPSQVSYVNSFNGLTGNVQGVSTFNGATGNVSFLVDGGQL